MKSSAKELFVMILSIVVILALLGTGIYFFIRERNREKSADAMISRAISLATVDISNPATITPVLELVKNTLVTETAKLEDLKTQMSTDGGRTWASNVSIPNANNADTNTTNTTNSDSVNNSNTNTLNSSNSLNVNNTNNQINPSSTASPSQNALTPAQIQAQLQAQIQAQQELVNNIQAEIAYLQQLLNDAILVNATPTPTVTPTTSQTNGAVPTNTNNPIPTQTPTPTATNSVSSTPNATPVDTFWDQFTNTIYIPKPSVVDTSGKPQLIEGMNPL